MNKLIEFSVHHPYLVGAAALMLAVVIVSEIRARLQAFAAVSPGQAVRLMNQGAVVIDVRTAEQFAAGHISEARRVDGNNLATEAEALKRFREKGVITCCDNGSGGASAARELSKLGFTKVVNLEGGLDAWRKENLPLVRGKA